jgi:hypothetical protein
MSMARNSGIFRGLSLLLVLGLLTVCAGCAGLRASRRDYTAGKILVLPARDVVQQGKPHPKGAGSGALLTESVVTRLRGTSFSVVTTNDPAFTHTKVASKEEALQEAKKLGADYCLQLVLGEFLNAAPMTFRPDYVYLSQGMMYQVSTGEAVWTLTAPHRLEKGNPGSHLPLVDRFSQMVVRSVTAGK